MDNITELSAQVQGVDDRVAKLIAWKKKVWLDFCKLVMETDKRYSILPVSMCADYTPSPFSMATEGVFGRQCLKRDGVLSDIFIIPMERGLGITIRSGSKFSGMSFNGYPSKTMIWPVLRIADELERQYIREVTIESSKHGNSLKISNKRRRA